MAVSALNSINHNIDLNSLDIYHSYQQEWLKQNRKERSKSKRLEAKVAEGYSY